MSETPFTPVPLTKHRRLPSRGSFDPKLVKSILDEGLIAHVGFQEEVEDWPVVIPMAYGLIGDWDNWDENEPDKTGRVVLHGHLSSRE
jgi:nitroimidazol reductase NimA-like FMN-containing flavoprotein (pyridoxamine 5'-phosphate oxidase superfamily)